MRGLRVIFAVALVAAAVAVTGCGGDDMEIGRASCRERV